MTKISEPSILWLKNHCRDYGAYPLVFSKETGMDIVIPNHPEFVIRPPRNYELRIELMSWRGISIGAIHFYASIKANGPYVAKLNDDGRWVIVGGWLCEEWDRMPREKKSLLEGFHVEAVHPLSIEEINKDPIRWEWYNEGDLVNSFNSMEAALAVATQIARLRFPDWKVTVDNYA